MSQPMTTKGDDMSTKSMIQPKEGEVIHTVPSRLDEAVGYVATVTMRMSDYNKMMKIIKLCNPASGEAELFK